jgi:hypothetical protein
MFQTAKEIGERTPTAPCRCNKPVPGAVLEDKDGKILETLCAQCRGAIRLKEEPGDTWAQYMPFPLWGTTYWVMP